MSHQTILEAADATDSATISGLFPSALTAARPSRLSFLNTRDYRRLLRRHSEHLPRETIVEPLDPRAATLESINEERKGISLTISAIDIPA
jgi:hypothetical protein